MGSRHTTKRVPVALPEMETQPERWLRGIRLSGFTLTLLLLFVLAVIVLAPSLKLLVEQQQELARAQQKVVETRAAVERLEAELDRWSDPAYIESQARDRLLYVYPGEYSYLVIDDDAGARRTSDGAPISDTIQTTQIDWVMSLVSSIYTAGLTDAAANELPSPSTEVRE